MGIIHGLTNLGGALLAVLASGVSTDKVAIRYIIAHYYLVFSFIQMLILGIFMRQHDMLIANSPTAVISASVYLLVGNRIFIHTNRQYYNFAMNIFMVVFGVIVFLNF